MSSSSTPPTDTEMLAKHVSVKICCRIYTSKPGVSEPYWGTGFVIGKYGPHNLILTNRHVVERHVDIPGKNSYILTSDEPPRVRKSDGQYPAFRKLYWCHGADLALIYSHQEVAFDKVAKLSNRVSLESGEQLVGFGYPLINNSTVTSTAPVTSVNDAAKATSLRGRYERTYEPNTQSQTSYSADGKESTTAMHNGTAYLVSMNIDSGHSGSAVFDTAGEVVGVVFLRIGNRSLATDEPAGALVIGSHIREFLQDAVYESWLDPYVKCVDGNREEWKITGLEGEWDYNKPAPATYARPQKRRRIGKY